MALGFPLRCPSCSADYLLPRSLLGPLGARVRCPACGFGFDVDRAGRIESATGASAAPGAASAPVATAPVSTASTDERVLARQVLDELTARLGPTLEEAARDGQLFGRHGSELMEAFDEYRRRAGGRVAGLAFREELLERWNLSLLPVADRRG